VNYQYPKYFRLIKRTEYAQVLRNSSRIQGSWVTIDYRHGNHPRPRLGITVSKKFGKAHLRNAFKRRVREAFRLTRPYLQPNLEVHVRPKKPIQRSDMATIYSEIKLMLCDEPLSFKSSAKTSCDHC
jgi:ribonuclease P protein component